MLNNMIKCKTCGRVVPKTTKKCPTCGSYLHMKAVTACMIIVAVAFIAVFALSDNMNEGTQELDVKDSAKPDETDVTPQTQTLSIDNWDITYKGYEVQDYIKTGIITGFEPVDGSSYLVVNLAVKNIDTKIHTFLPSLYFGAVLDVKIIYNEYEYTHSTLIGYEEDLTNEEINPLITVNGILAFEIPESITESKDPLILRFFIDDEQIDFTVE